MDKDKIKSRAINIVSSKWTWIIGFLAVAFFWQSAVASANYYDLTCSDFYSGYCSENNDCYTHFGDDGTNYGDFCFYTPTDYDFDKNNLDLAWEVSVAKTDMLISVQTFLANVLGFWLPFSVILNFCMFSLFALLLKFGFFKKY